MSPLSPYSPIVTAVGWALVSFLWQALLLHGALLLALRLVPVRRSAARYLLGLVALAALVLAPVSTVVRYVSEPVTVPSGLTGLVQVPHPELAETPATAPHRTSIEGFSTGLRAVLALGWPVNVQVLMGKVSRYLPLVVLAWLLGVALSLGRLMGDVGAVRRLRREGVCPAPPWLAEMVSRQMGRGRRAVPVLVSEQVNVPMVIGVLKPLVLVPVSALSGLTPRQLELIIAHELEHVRRFDPVINQLQCVVEAVFFFHPSVGAINRLVRQEREHRTDAAVARLAGGGRDYATALGQLARVALVSGPHLAATGGDLSNRVRRVLGAPEEPTSGLGGALGLAVVGLLLVVGAALASPGPGDLAGQIIANPGIIEQLTDEDLDQLLRQAVEAGAEEQDKHLELLLLLADRAAEDSRLTAMYIVNADLLSPGKREVAREVLFAAQREAANREATTDAAPVETFEIPHNAEPNYATGVRSAEHDLVLRPGFDMNRAGLAGWGAEALPAGRSLLYVRNHFFPHDGLDRTRLLEGLDLSELSGLPGLEPETFGVLLTKFPVALYGANRFSNPDYTLAELLEQRDLGALEGPWSVWVDDGNVVTRRTSFERFAERYPYFSPTPPQLLCLEDGVVVGGLRAAGVLDSVDLFERVYADCLSGAWGSEWNPLPPAVGQAVPPFPLVSGAGDGTDSETWGGRPTLLAFLSPVEEPPLVVEVGRYRESDAPEPAPQVRVEQLTRLIREAGVDARLVVVAVPYSHGGATWTSAEVAEALRDQLSTPVFEDPSDTLWLELNQFRIRAGDVVLLDADGRFVELFRDFNRLETTADAIGFLLSDALARLARAR